MRVPLRGGDEVAQLTTRSTRWPKRSRAASRPLAIASEVHRDRRSQLRLRAVDHPRDSSSGSIRASMTFRLQRGAVSEDGEFPGAFHQRAPRRLPHDARDPQGTQGNTGTTSNSAPGAGTGASSGPLRTGARSTTRAKVTTGSASHPRHHQAQGSRASARIDRRRAEDSQSVQQEPGPGSGRARAALGAARRDGHRHPSSRTTTGGVQQSGFRPLWPLPPTSGSSAARPRSSSSRRKRCSRVPASSLTTSLRSRGRASSSAPTRSR